MSEVRKVIGVLDQLVAKSNGIAFPSVRVWVRGANDYVTHGLERLFPDRGTVYLHVSACENEHPQRNQVGLFNCVESPGQKAEWRVNSTSRHLARVVECPAHVRKLPQLAFWDWLLAFKESPQCNILLNQGIVYLSRGKRELVGPFTASADGKLTPREPTLVFEGVDVISIDVSGRRCGFIDTDLLPKGKPIVLDPRDAIHRCLKLAAKTSQLEWLSRAKSQELSAALTGVAGADGSEWVMENLPLALESLVLSGRFDEKLAQSLLHIKGLEDGLELAWKQKHLEAVKMAHAEITALKDASEAIKQSMASLKSDFKDLELKKGNLEKELLALNGKFEAAKVEAHAVFEAELKRLAQSPVSMALIGAWTGGGSKPTDRCKPLVRIQKPTSELRPEGDFRTALLNNLKSCNLSPTVATEITTVCCASLAARQPIAIRSLFADMLANAVTVALGQTATIWADVPAGLLDPIDWDDLVPCEHRECPHVLQNANRSDIPLVLGSLRRGVLEQALGIQKPSATLLLTLESNEAMQVEKDFPVGPLIDERILRFTAGKAVTGLSAFPNYAVHLPEIAPMSAEEFAEIGDALRRLPLFKLSANENVFRHAYAALVKSCEKPEHAPRLFFKYWCLPRCSTEEVVTVLNAHKEKWAQDKLLIELTEALQGNG